MKEILWKLATKQLREQDWKRLAFHWRFDESHIKAIEHQYTGTTCLQLQKGCCKPWYMKRHHSLQYSDTAWCHFGEWTVFMFRYVAVSGSVFWTCMFPHTHVIIQLESPLLYDVSEWLRKTVSVVLTFYSVPFTTHVYVVTSNQA